MKKTDDARLLQQLVPADNGGSSGIPGGAQRPVPDDTGDLRRRYKTIQKRRRKLLDAASALYHLAHELDTEGVRVWLEIEATKTPVGGNRVLSEPGSDKP